MSPGTSPGYRARTFYVSQPPIGETVSSKPLTMGRQAPASSPSINLSWLPTLILVLFVVLLIAVGAGLLLSRWPDLFGPAVPNRGETPISSEAVPRPTDAPTVVSVDNRCPAGCVDFATAAMPLAVQPVVLIVTYPVVYQQVVPEAMPHGHGMGRYEPVDYAGPVCSMQSIHVVRPGDTVYGIARRFGVDPYGIVEANGLPNPNYIQIGQVLSIPCAPALWYGFR